VSSSTLTNQPRPREYRRRRHTTIYHNAASESLTPPPPPPPSVRRPIHWGSTHDDPARYITRALSRRNRPDPFNMLVTVYELRSGYRLDRHAVCHVMCTWGLTVQPIGRRQPADELNKSEYFRLPASYLISSCVSETLNGNTYLVL
jgi:hypothetical protein